MSECVSVNIRGKPASVRFPPICVRCCAPGAESILVERSFGSSVVRFRPQFCARCAAEHRRDVKPVPLNTKIWRALKTELTYAMAGPFAIGLFLISRLSTVPMLIGVVFMLMGFGVFLLAWDRTAYLSLTPATSVTGTISFTSDLSETFEPEWRRFTFQNSDYATRFTDVNRDHIWEPRGEAALKAASRRFDLKIIGYLLLAALVLYWIYDDYIRPLL